MPYQSETDAEFRFLEELIGDYRGGAELGAEARICQACGETARIPSLEHRIAALEYGGDFVSFWEEHENCLTGRGLFTGWRYCEVCRSETAAIQENRTSHWWICGDCRSGLRQSRNGEAQTLGILARWRGARHGTHGGRFRILPRNLPLEGDIPIAVVVSGGWVPIGLRECPECHWGTGVTYTAAKGGGVGSAEARCRCEIPRCRDCGARTLLGVPGTSSFSISRGYWVHTGRGMITVAAGRCQECLYKAGIQTMSYGEAIGKLDSEERVKAEKLLDKWAVEDARRDRGE